MKTLKGFGIDKMQAGIVAASAILHYLSETQHNKTSHIKNISRIEEDKYVWLDRFTVRNLELLYSTNEDATTLLDVLDKTITPPGSRMLKRWMIFTFKRNFTNSRTARHC